MKMNPLMKRRNVEIVVKTRGVSSCGFRFIPAGYSDVKPATVPI